MLALDGKRDGQGENVSAAGYAAHIRQHSLRSRDEHGSYFVTHDPHDPS